MTTYQNLFVTKLPRNINDADLLSVFSVFSPKSAKVMLDAATGKSKGFGFVLFDTPEHGLEVFNAMNHKHVSVHGHGFTLNIFPSKHDGRTATVESNALYIRNIPVSMDKPAVELFLSNFGTMTYCAMREDHYGSPVWVVYVEYDCIECAKNALQALHGSNTYFHDSPAPILAKFADCDEAKKERRRRREDARTQVAVPSAVPVTHVAPATHAAVPQQPASNPLSSDTAVVAPATVSMFKPGAIVNPSDIDAGKTIFDAPKVEPASREGSVSFSSAYSLSHSGYRHNPYGYVPTPVKADSSTRSATSPVSATS